MTNVIKLTQKAFTWSVVLMTILWSVGAAALVPTVALAENHEDDVELAPGDLFLIEGDTAVYVLTEDMEAMYFPNSRVYHTWFSDFSGVNQITQMQGTAYPLASPAGVNYRPGSRLIKRTSDPRVFAVGPGNMRHLISSPEVAASLYGANWASLVSDVHVSHWSNTALGDALEMNMPHDGQLIAMAGEAAAEGDVWYVWGGECYLVEGDLPAPAANNVRELSEEALDNCPDSGETVTAGSILDNPSQMEAGDGEDMDEDEDEDMDDDEEVVPAGDVEFSLSASTPATALVPDTATQVPYLAFTVEAGAEDALVKEIEFERIGQGDDANFDKVWLTVNGLSVSQEQSVNSDDSVSLRPNYTIGAGDEVTFVLVANLVSTGADNTMRDAFRIASADMIDANGADVDGDFPIRGNEMAYSNYDPGTATIDDRGSAQEVEVGEEQVIIGEFVIDFNSNNETDAQFHSLRLKMEGTANMSDLENVALYEDGDKIVDAAVWGDYATFQMEDEVIEDGRSRDFEVRADIVDGEDAETIIWELEDNRDLHIAEVDGFGVAIDSTSLTGSDSNRLKTYTLDAGQMTVSRDASSPANEQYSADTEDITALVGRMDLGQTITVDGLKVYLHTDSNVTAGAHADIDDAINADIERAELWVNDERVGSALTAVTAGAAVVNDGNVDEGEFYYNFNSSFELEDDDLLTLVIDLEEAATAGRIYKFEFDAANDFDDPEYVGTSENVPSGKKSGSAIGRNVEVQAASVTVTRNDGFPSGETFVGGVSNELFFQFVVDAGNASDITMETMVFRAAVSTDATWFTSANGHYSKFTNCYLSDDEGATAIADESDDMDAGSAYGTLTFDNLDYDIAESDQVEIGLYCDLGSGVDATTGLTFTLQSNANGTVIEDNQDTAISVSAEASASLNTADTGSLTVSVSDGDTADPSIVVAKSTAPAVPLTTWLFDADDDDIQITDLYLANIVGGSTSTAADNRIRALDLYVDGELVNSKIPASGVAHFDLDDEDDRIVVPKDEQVLVELRARLNNITQLSQTHVKLQYGLYAMVAQSASPGSDLASISAGVQGEQIGATATGGEGGSAAPTGNLVIAYKTIPTLATVALNNTTLVNGAMDIYKFSVSADSNGPVNWNQVSLSVSGDHASGEHVFDGITTGTVKLFDGSGDQVTVSTTKDYANNLLHIQVKTSAGGLTTESVGAGQTETYRVRATLSNYTAGNAITVNIAEDSANQHLAAQTLANAVVDASGSAQDGAFVWSDNSGTFQSTTTAQWFTGKDVPGLDTQTVSVEKPT